MTTTWALAVGDRIKLAPDARLWWRVQAVSQNFAACVQQVPFAPKGTLRYTVIDWRKGIRGPCNLVGQGYGDGSYSEAVCAEMLTEFENYDRLQAEYDKHPTGESFSVDYHALEISHRNNVPLRVLEVRRGARAA